MNRKSFKRITLLSLVLFGLIFVASASTAAAHSHGARFRVTLENLAAGQPLSPPVAVTHRLPVRLFTVGRPASGAIEALAEDGNESVAVDMLTGAAHVTEVVDVGMPLTPHGTTFGDFTDTVTFEISAQPGDRLSLASMLICTNDGFTGADGARLPRRGVVNYYLNAYDAGTEDNTEASSDIVDPCSALGPVGLNGDPNGNEDAAVNTDPAQNIQYHAGIAGTADLLEAHNWDGPIARLTIERID